jgi:N-acetyl-gamma-glutamyl-phosphate reductase
VSCAVADPNPSQTFAQGSPRVLVAGATGFAGALAAHLLWRHPRFELIGVTGRSEVGRRLDELYPRYRVPLRIERLDLDHFASTASSDRGPGSDQAPGSGEESGSGRESGSGGEPGSGPQSRLDAAVVAYPHAAAAPTVGALRELGVRVVDLSADFRLSSQATYEQWYGPHPRPDLLDRAVYGLTELHRARIADAPIVANPGCYPTAAVLGLAPLARAGLIADVVIDAKQGISGAGRVFDETTHLSMAGENILPYNVASHRHTPEIEEQLGLLGAELPVQFQAHLVPLDQGELASCYVTPTRTLAPAELGELYEDAYTHEPFVEVVTAPPGTRDVRETNVCRVFAAADPHTGKVVVLSAIDNLWKGTSSQAVQNLNVMYGMPETEGLT